MKDSEVINVKKWADENQMVLNLEKTWEMALKGHTSKPLPDVVNGIKHRDWLCLLSCIMQEIQRTKNVKQLFQLLFLSFWMKYLIKSALGGERHATG